MPVDRLSIATVEPRAEPISEPLEAAVEPDEVELTIQHPAEQIRDKSVKPRERVLPRGLCVILGLQHRPPLADDKLPSETLAECRGRVGVVTVEEIPPYVLPDLPPTSGS